MRVLKNLGFDPPTPVSTYYDWPGRYKPYAHQKATVEFFTTHPRCFSLSGMGCISGDELVRVSRKGKSTELPLRDLYKKFTTLPDKDSWKARSLKGEVFGMNRLLDVLYKGEQQTIRITLDDGKTFRCTPDHHIARPGGGWTQAGVLRVGDALVTNGTVMLECPKCGVPRPVGKYYVATANRLNRVCNACRHEALKGLHAGDKNPAWKGGKWVDPDGYVRLLMPTHPRADNHGYVYEHIVVGESIVGHPVTREWHIHHLNGCKSDNRPENLQVMSESDHHKSHSHYAKLDGSVSGRGGTVVVVPKTARITSIEPGGVTDVYDLCMEAPHHNFVVNGVVVHNSGKTLCALWAFDYLRKAGIVKRMLVISPLSTLERAWGDEIFRNFFDMSFAVLHGTAEKRRQLLALDFDVYLINHDGIINSQLWQQLRDKDGLDLVVIDEIAEFRNASTRRHRALFGLVKDKKWVWGMTGTPTPNAPTDAWAQCRLIDPSRVPKYYGAFRDSVMKQVTSFKWSPREEALTLVKNAMQPSIRFSREDCIDLPPTTFVTRHTTLTPEQEKAYNQMMRTLQADTANGQITAINEAVKVSKLVQICVGVSYGTDGDVVIPAKHRIDLVREIIEEAGAKVLVFVPLTGALKVVAEELSRDYTVAVVHGETSKPQRDEIFKNFQLAKDPHVLVANAGTMSHGLTMTSANTVIWFAPINSNGVYMQACARVTRPGQTRNTLIVNIEATPLERMMYARLQGKQKMQGLLLDLLKGG